MTIATPLPYEPRLFLGRLEEINAVKDALDAMINGTHPQLIMFRGSRGHGKTWLSLHLQRTIIPDWQKEHQITNLKTIWIGLDRNPKRAYGDISENQLHYFSPSDPHSTPEVLTQNLLYQIAEQIDALRIPNAGYIQTQWIVETLQRKTSASTTTPSQYLVLILDSLFEMDWAYLGEIERTLLTPLSELPNVLLILTGRGREYLWNTAKFRDVEARQLKSFSQEIGHDQRQVSFLRRQLEDQIFSASPMDESRKQKIITDVETYSRGYPLNNWLIAQSLIDPATWENHLEQLLEVYPDFTELDKAAIKGLSILSPKARFREEEVEILGTVAAGRSLPGRSTRQQLQAANVIRWNKGGWVIEESLAAFYDALLHLNQAERNLCIQLHQAAVSMYKTWQDQENNPVLFLEEIEYHKARLKSLSPEPQAVLYSLSTH